MAASDGVGSGTKGKTEVRRALEDAALARLGLVRGQPIRFARGGGRWIYGSVTRPNTDGSVGLVTASGHGRNARVSEAQVRVPGARGGQVWRPLEGLGPLPVGDRSPRGGGTT